MPVPRMNEDRELSLLGIDPIGSASASMAPLGSYAPGRGVGEGVESRYLLASSVDGGRRDG